jgi:4-amino-4-deoxy-L-arabinose transferase-like glycosyltransferase
MRRIFSHSVAALAAGLCLRLFFIYKYPASSGDTILYEQMATNWLRHRTYAMEVYGQITPVDLRMPGYPAFLALIYAITGRAGADAHFAVMAAQAAVDLLSCVLVAVLAATLCLMVNERNQPQRVFIAAIWLSTLCPFAANYTAVLLTEVFAGFLTITALLPLCLLVGRARNNGWLFIKKSWQLANNYSYLAALAGLLVGIGTLFRPEAPLLLVACWVVLGFVLISQHETGRWLRTVMGMALACAIPLTPWAIRNAVTLHELQFLAPKNSNLPGELVPYGFMSWEKTWLYRFRDVYLVPWKLNDEPIDVANMPSQAFDTPEEKDRVAAILEPYNKDLTLTPEEDAAFGQLARERTARHPLRTYVWLPSARAITMWFTPRIELIPISGTVFPLRQAWNDDRIDLSVTVGLFLLNIVCVALAIWGALRLWRRSTAVRPAVALLVVFVLLRTAFLTTLETPEPRYVLVCFPALIALAAHVFAGNSSSSVASAG